jgi:hypothetical protein
MKRRSTQTGSFPTDLATGVHLSLGNAPGLKAINNIFRDAAGAVGSSSTATDVEVTGNLMCYGGWFANDRTHGHGVYAQNRTGTKRFANNVVFWNASHGMHAYGSPAAGVQQFVMENNTFFNNGELFDDTLRGRNFLLGGGATTSDCRVLNNLLYRAQPRVEHSSSDFMLGFATGMTNCVIRGNYVVGQTYLSGPFQNVKIVDNTFQGSMFSDPARRVAELYPENRYTPQRPAVEQVFVRPNEHEPQCGTITIFNWPKAERVRVDITPLGLAAGDRYELRSAIDYFGDVTFGVLSGQEIEVGMTNHTVVPPANLPTPPTPFPEFGVFLLRKLPSEPGNQAAERR